MAMNAIKTPGFLKDKPNPEVNGSEDITKAMEHFGVTQKDLHKVLSAALEKGGDYADLFFEHSFRNNISLQDGAVNRASSNIDFGMGVRVLSGDQTGYAYIENITLEEMLSAARTAARIATGTNSHKEIKMLEQPFIFNYYDVDKSWEEFAVNQKAPFLQKLNDRIFALDSRVHKVMASLGDTTSHILFCNSEGQIYYDYRPMVTQIGRAHV